MIVFDPDLDSPGQSDTKSARKTAASRPRISNQDRIPSQRTLAAFLGKAQAAVRLKGQVTVLLTTDMAIRRLNRQFRGKNKATDVLSFPAPEFAEGVAGDLAISVDTARKQAGEQAHALGVEIKILLLHGLLHLAGYDHEIDNGEMARRERVLRGKLGLPQGLIERVQSDSKSGSSAVTLSHPSRKKRAKNGAPGVRAIPPKAQKQKRAVDGAPLVRTGTARTKTVRVKSAEATR